MVEMAAMVDKEEVDQLIWYLLRGNPTGFRICKLIQEAVSYKRAIPKSFWLDEEKGMYGILGFETLNKNEMRRVRNEVIARIIEEISNPEKKLSDNYVRLFHALTIFKVSKADSRVPAIGKNYMYNIAYDLWALDTGDEAAYGYISGIAWYAAEAFKENKLEGTDLITGRRHSF